MDGKDRPGESGALASSRKRRYIQTFHSNMTWRCPLQNEHTKSFLMEHNLVERIEMAFDDMVEEHTKKSMDEFNEDETYKQLTSEAIDLKSMAIKKMETFVEFSTSASSMALNLPLYHKSLSYIEQCALLRFKRPDVVQRALETASFDFPWDKIDSEEIDLMDWSPDAHDSEYETLIDTISKEVKKNASVKKFILNGMEFNLENGWNTERVKWSYGANTSATEESFAIVAQLVLSCCCCLKSVEIHCR